jgi:serine/threonine protein kinase HipA of HipAB toxin-antitoxin module
VTGGKWLAVDQGAFDAHPPCAEGVTAPSSSNGVASRKATAFPLEERLSPNDRRMLLLFREHLPCNTVIW